MLLPYTASLHLLQPTLEVTKIMAQRQIMEYWSSNGRLNYGKGFIKSPSKEPNRNYLNCEFLALNQMKNKELFRQLKINSQEYNN